MTTLRRQVKNMVKNYSEAEVKVREATSNDPWGPSSTLMSEISDLTYNIVALGEVMRMIWKRLNDHGKNWRHVYKSLVLLDYLIKNGNEKVAQQCKEHIVAIQTLKDFQYMEEQKDQGSSVREKAKQLVSLLRDDDRLKQERVKALRARERFAQNAMGISSDNKMTFATNAAATGRLHAGVSARGNYADPYGSGLSTASGTAPVEGAAGLAPDLEAVRPSDANEEDLQIKLAIMLSQQEHEEEVQRKRADEAKLHLALEQSKTEGQPNGLVDLGENDPWGSRSSASQPTSSGFGANFRQNDSDDDLFPPLSNSKQTSNNSAVDPWGTSNGGGGAGSKSTAGAGTNGFNNVDPWLNSNAATLTTTTPTATATNPWLPSSAATNGAAATSLVDPWSTGGATTATAAAAAVKPAGKFDDFDLFSNNRITTSPPPSSSAGVANLSNNSVNNNSHKSNTNGNGLSNDDPFGDFFGGSGSATTSKANTNPWDSASANAKQNDFAAPLNNNGGMMPQATSNSDISKAAAGGGAKTRKTPESFLGENASLVNLENLIPTNNSNNMNGGGIGGGARPKSTNPFGAAPTASTPTPMSGLTGLSTSSSSGQLSNPFAAAQQSQMSMAMSQQQRGPSINQLQQQQAATTFAPFAATGVGSSLPPLAQPLIIPPSSSSSMAPFMGMNTQPTAMQPPFQFPNFAAQPQSSAAISSSLFPSLAGVQATSQAPAASTNPFLMM